MNTLPNINKKSKHIRSAALFNAAKNTLNSAKEIPKGINFLVSSPQSLSKNPLNMSLESSKKLSLTPPETLSQGLPMISSSTNVEKRRTPMNSPLNSPKMSLVIPPEYTSMPKLSIQKNSKNQYFDNRGMLRPPLPPIAPQSRSNTLPQPPKNSSNLGGTQRKRRLRKTSRKRRRSIKSKHIINNNSYVYLNVKKRI